MNSAIYSHRLANCWDKIKSEKRAGLITFITASDPNHAISEQILTGLPNVGADIIEIGMPFSDPMADGPAVQAASLRALAAGATVQTTLNLVKNFRETDNHTPIILMGYYNPIYRFGAQHFLAAAKSAGVDGLIVVDLPPEEDKELCDPAMDAGIHWIRLLSPTTNARRLPLLLRHASGFLYYISVMGVTGANQATTASIDQAIKEIKAATALPIAVGFGIRTPQQVKNICSQTDADAVVVGSALVDKVKDGIANGSTNGNIISAVLDYTQSLSAALVR